MATGRTLPKWMRVYADGYDISGFGRTIGPLELTHDEADLTAYMGDVVKGYLRNGAHANVGTFNAVFDNTAVTGIHALMNISGISRTVMVPIGSQAAPIDGDVCFGGVFLHKGYQETEDGGAVTVTLPFTGWAANAASLLYASPWGQVIHVNAVRLVATGVNTLVGFDNPTVAQTIHGGIFMWQVFAGDGTATIKMDDSATNLNDASFAPVALATSGEIDFTGGGFAGIVALPNTGASAIVRRYLRWQIAFNAATTITFASAFFRAY